MVKTAEELGATQRDISVAEFFERNRHLLGFDNKRKALLTTIKEAVDNSLDACEDAGVLPEISVEVIDMGNERFRVVVEDNGPGIIKTQLPNIFAKLLYGSKFHTMKQQRGQQGIGISAAVLYAQLTTGKPARIVSRIGKGKPALQFELHIDTMKNKPEILVSKEVDWHLEHGTRIELDLEATYQKGDQSVDTYLKETAIVNPHATIIYTNPKAEQLIFARVTESLPKQAKEIKPHPYGVEIGTILKMVKSSEARTLQSFLTTEFSRVGAGTAKEICENARLLPNTKLKQIKLAQVEQLAGGIKKTKIISPPTDCIAPIKAVNLEKGLRKEVLAEFYTSVTRPPQVYRGIPFCIEVALAYGGSQQGDSPITLMRFANRVPLLYQQRSGSIYKALTQTNWRLYGLQQSSGQLPNGPLTIVVHMASVWPPFTSEAKEALAHYTEIIKEIKLAIQECGRKLAVFVRKKKKISDESKKRGYIGKYIPHVAAAIAEIMGYDKHEVKDIEEDLTKILTTTRGRLEEIKVDDQYYDEEFAKIGKDDSNQSNGSKQRKLNEVEVKVKNEE